MSENFGEESAPAPSGGDAAKRRFFEVRYSLAEIMREVKEERSQTDRKEELVDSTEISKMFTRRKRKKKSS